jgi:hypothetical protein
MLILKSTKNQWVWVLVSIIVMVISALAGDPGSNQAFIGAIAGVIGGLAKGALSLFGGKGKAARKEAKQAKKDAKAAQKAAEIEAKTKQIEAETATTKAKSSAQGFANILKQYWWVAAVILAAVFLMPMLKKKVGSGARRSRSGPKGTAWSRKMLAAKRRKKTRRK